MIAKSSSLSFVDVTVRYPKQERDALTGVSLSAGAGELTAVVGPNGSGKSTLVRALLRRVPVRGGAIVIGEDNVACNVTDIDAREFARRVAVVPQREEPTVPMRVPDFVALGRHAHRTAFGALSRVDVSAVSAAIARVDLDDAVTRRTDELSGGEWQRVRIARALAQDAPILVLDEPTAFLDIAHEMAVFELLDGLAHDGHTVLLVSHQLNLVARFASRIVLLEHGAVAADGTADVVMRGEILERVYDWPLVVTRDPAVGAPSLLPLRRGVRAIGSARVNPADA